MYIYVGKCRPSWGGEFEILILWTNRINTQILQAIKILHSYNMKTKYCISVFSQLYSSETWCFIDSRNSLCALVSSPFSLAASTKTVNFSCFSLWYLWVSAAMHTYIPHLYSSPSFLIVCVHFANWSQSKCGTLCQHAGQVGLLIWDAWPPYPQGPQPMVLHARYVGGMRVYGSIDVKEIPSSFFIYFVLHKSSIDIFITLQETVSLNLCPHSSAITFPLNAYLFLWLCLLLLLACLTTFFFCFLFPCMYLTSSLCMQTTFPYLARLTPRYNDISKPRIERQISYQWPLKIGRDEHKKWFSHTLKQTTHLHNNFKNHCIVQ